MQPFNNSAVFRSNQSKKPNKMNNQKSILFLFLILSTLVLKAQDDEEEFILFNDRRNVVHGVYLGFSMGYGEIDGKDTYLGGLKLAYVANRQLEIGFAGKFLYSNQDVFNPASGTNDDLFAAYGGLHLEPILFGKSKVSLSFPVLIGAGAVGYIDRDAVRNDVDVDIDEDDVDAVFVLEPGVSALFNINRFVQLETGVKYRFSSQIELIDSPVDRINGFSAEIGIKLGIFNMGKNRYKKQLNQ
jgi:hypothetical protein